MTVVFPKAITYFMGQREGPSVEAIMESQTAFFGSPFKNTKASGVLRKSGSVTEMRS